MSIKNKIGLGMIALFILVTTIGNFLDGFWHGVTFISVVAWILMHVEVFARAWLDGYVVGED